MGYEAPNRLQQENRNIQMVYAMRPPFAGLAIAAFVCGTLGVLSGITVVLGGLFGVLGIALGTAAVRKINRSWEPKSGKGLAIAGIVLASLGIVEALFVVLAAQALSSALSG